MVLCLSLGKNPSIPFGSPPSRSLALLDLDRDGPLGECIRHCCAAENNILEGEVGLTAMIDGCSALFDKHKTFQIDENFLNLGLFLSASRFYRAAHR